MEFFGAVGTLASLGEQGIEVQERLAEELDLTAPETACHTSRDRLLELLHAFTAVGGTLGRIGRQILVLNREEIREVEEPIPEETVGSSTRRHKQNPVKSNRTVGLSILLRGQANAMDALFEGYRERDAGLWYVEYALLPDAFLYLHRALRNIRETVTNLKVNADKMRDNMKIHGGLVTSEAVMMALAESVGRQTAHDIVHEAAMDAIEGEQSFGELLLADERVGDALSPAEVASLTDPTNYTGVADVLATRGVEQSREQGPLDHSESPD